MMRSSSRWLNWWPLLVIGVLLLAPPVHAHKPSEAVLVVRSEGGQVRWALDLALRDLDAALGIDDDHDGVLRWGEVRAAQPRIAALVAQGLQLGADGRDCPLGAMATSLRRRGSETSLALEGAADCGTDGAGDTLQLRYALFASLDAGHRLLLIDAAGARMVTPRGAPQPVSLQAAVPRALAVGTSAAPDSQAPADEKRPDDGAFRSFLEEGVHHIVTGWDHLAFLALLLAPAALRRENGRWVAADRGGPVMADVVRIVTAFTVAHSITLGLAAFGWVTLPAWVIEPAIAATVIWAAWSNLAGGTRLRRWPAAFGFGLVHGFGFAYALGDAGLSGAGLGWALLGFNLGVELGQLMFVAVCLPLLWLARGARLYAGAVLPGVSWGFAALGAYWLVERTLLAGA